MPRRFALALLCLLVLLLSALLLGRHYLPRLRPAPKRTPVPTARPTPVIPPTPIPPRRVALYFEGSEDERFHPEARDLPAALDDAAFVKSIAAAVLEGPRRPELLRPFPEGWTVRGAFRMKDGLVFLDLAPPAPPDGSPPPRWETGTHEEEGAVASLLLSVTKNAPDVARVVLLVGGEPVETLAGHLDLTHPLHADPARAVDEAPLEPPPPTPAPTATPAASGTPALPAAPSAAAPPPAPAPGRSPSAPPPREVKPRTPTPTPTAARRPPAETA